jgi:hypothetical protein
VEEQKTKKKHRQTNKSSAFPRLDDSRPPGNVIRNRPAAERAAMPTPNSGCCCCSRRGAALHALSVSVRGLRAAAAAAVITVARRYSATIVSFSLEILTPLFSIVDDVGFSLLRRALSVPASDVIGR